MDDKRNRRSFAPIKSSNSSRFRRKATQTDTPGDDDAFQVITPFHKDYEDSTAGPSFSTSPESLGRSTSVVKDGDAVRKESRRLMDLLKGKSFGNSSSKMDQLMVDGIVGSDADSFADRSSARASGVDMDIHALLRSESIDGTSESHVERTHTMGTEDGRGSNVSVKSSNSRGSMFSLLRLRRKSKRFVPNPEAEKKAYESLKAIGGTAPNPMLGSNVVGTKRGFGFFSNNRVSMDSSTDSKGGSFRSNGSSWTWGTGSFKGSWRSSKAFGASRESITDRGRGSYTSGAASDASSAQGGARWRMHQLLSTGSDRSPTTKGSQTEKRDSATSQGGQSSFLGKRAAGSSGSSGLSGKGSSGVSVMQKLWRRAMPKRSTAAKPTQTTNDTSGPASGTAPAHSHDRGSFALPRVSERRFSIEPQKLKIKSVLGWGGFGNVFLVQVAGDEASEAAGNASKRNSHDRIARRSKAIKGGKRQRKLIVMSKNKEDGDGASSESLSRPSSFAANGYRALKVMQKAEILAANAVPNIQMEIKAMKELSHGGLECPFLIKLHDAFQTSTRLFLLMDFAAGGELFFHLQRDIVFSLPRARLYFLEIALAIGHLHSMDIIYRDLKSENVLLDRQGHIKLTDFGLCKRLAVGMRATTLCGTPDYAAPEAVRGEGYDLEADWWALGVLLFEMLVGGAPFSDKNLQVMYHKICYSPIMIPDRLDREARSMIERLLARTPRERLGYGRACDGGDILSIQFHPFVRNHYDVNEVLKLNVKPEFRPNIQGDQDTSNFAEKFTSSPITMVDSRKPMIQQLMPPPTVMMNAPPVVPLTPSAGMERMGLGSPSDPASPLSLDASLAEDADVSLHLERPHVVEIDQRCDIDGFRWVKEPLWFPGHAVATALSTGFSPGMRNFPSV